MDFISKGFTIAQEALPILASFESTFFSSCHLPSFHCGPAAQMQYPVHFLEPVSRMGLVQRPCGKRTQAMHWMERGNMIWSQFQFAKWSLKCSVSTLLSPVYSTLLKQEPRRCRTIFSASQLNILNEAFMENPYPGIDSREELAKAIGVSESRVHVSEKQCGCCTGWRWTHLERGASMA